jgi:CMP-N-acetylneuraminic acid synthetase
MGARSREGSKAICSKNLKEIIIHPLLVFCFMFLISNIQKTFVALHFASPMT